MNQIPQWHPKLNVYKHEDLGLLLLGEMTSLWLSDEHFPGMEHIDGQLDETQITQKLTAKGPQQGAMFLYQLNQLRKSDLVVTLSNDKQANDELPKYCRQKTDSAMVLVQIDRYSIVSLSAAQTDLLVFWCSLIDDIALVNSQLANKTVSFLLVDDFLDPRIADIVAGAYSQNQHSCVVKITGEKLWIGPLTSGDNPLQWRQFQRQLSDNQPVRLAAKNLYPAQNNMLPFAINTQLSEENQQQLQQIFSRQFAADAHELIQLTLQTNQLAYHSIIDYDANPISFAEQVESPVDLQRCVSVFDHDGGSRSVTPQQTLARLSKLVSPVTGIVTHIEALETRSDDPINIYLTSFFKIPTARQASKIDNDSFVQTCLGKGVSHDQSKASALCETVERYSAHYRGEEPSILAKQSQLEVNHYSYQQLTPYSDTQYKQFADHQHADSRLKQAAKKYDDTQIQWIPLWSLTNKDKVYVPLSSCFSYVPFDDEQFGRWHSNGAAAGNTIEEAILQALFELIERDATAIWWYNQVPRPAFDINRIAKDNLDKLTESLHVNHDFWVLDVTTDIGVPAMVAIGKHKSNGGYIMGLGCHFQPELAAQRALTELCQLIPIRDQNNAPFDFDAIKEGPYLHPCDKSTTVSTADKGHDIKQDILNVVGKLAGLKLETIVLNYSRNHLPIKTAKVFVPGLCHIWPQFGNDRLYQVPVRLGWLSKKKTEFTINPQALYI
ncbi:MAG: YcaO-like family protein [Algicola sp.]|nr:YcaO-like family protein [Algicola sp.]